MKKINNRGFAISTMLYGLLIIMVLMMALLMNTLAFTRNNSKKFVNEVVDKLQKREMNITVVDVTEDTKSKGYYLQENYTFNVKIKINNSLSKVSKNCGSISMPVTPKIEDKLAQIIEPISCYSIKEVSGEENTFLIPVKINTGNDHGKLTLFIGSDVFTNVEGDKTKSTSLPIADINNETDDPIIMINPDNSYDGGGENTKFNLRIYRKSDLPVTFDSSKKITIPINNRAYNLENLAPGSIYNASNLRKDTNCTDKDNCYIFNVDLIYYTSNGNRTKDIVDQWLLVGEEYVELQVPSGMFGNKDNVLIKTDYKFCSTKYKNSCKGWLFRQN